MLGAAGAVEAIASVKALETGILPPTAGLLEPDPDCDLEYIANTARLEPVSQALSLSMGFGGHNACVLFKRE
jgi:3-oxoacyl-(acyl-carrier-protein) synthase